MRCSEDYEVDEDEKELKGIKVLNLVNSHFTITLHFKNYRLQESLMSATAKYRVE